MPLSIEDESDLKKDIIEYIRNALTDSKTLIETLKSSQYVSNISPRMNAFNEHELRTALNELNNPTDDCKYTVPHPNRLIEELKQATFTEEEIVQMSPAEIAIYASIVIQMRFFVTDRHTQSTCLDQETEDLTSQQEQLTAAIKNTNKQLYPTIKLFSMIYGQQYKGKEAEPRPSESGAVSDDKLLLKTINLSNKDIQLMPPCRRSLYNQALASATRDTPLTKPLKSLLKQSLLTHWNTEKPIYQALEKMKKYSSSRPVLGDLHKELYEATTVYFNSPQTPTDKENLNKRCEKAVKESMNQIKEHQGFFQRLGELLYCIGTIIDSPSLKTTGEKILDSDTRSMQITKNFKTEIEKLTQPDAASPKPHP